MDSDEMDQIGKVCVMVLKAHLSFLPHGELRCSVKDSNQSDQNSE